MDHDLLRSFDIDVVVTNVLMIGWFDLLCMLACLMWDCCRHIFSV